MVDYVSDANELAKRLRAWSFNSSGDNELLELKNKVQVIPGVTADLLTEGAELLYAHKDLLDESGLRIMGELYNYAHEQHWTTFNQDGRSKRIVDGVAYELGDRRSKPSGDDPAPQANRRGGFDWRNPEAVPASPVPPLPPAVPPAEREAIAGAEGG